MRKGFAQLLILIPVFALIVAIAGFYYYNQSKSSKTQTSNTLETASQKTENSHTCKLAIDKKYFPPSILNYKLIYTSATNVQATAMYLGDNNDRADFSIRTVEFSRSLVLSTEVTDSRSARLKNDPVYIELLTKAWKGEASQKELDRIGDLLGVSSRYEEVNGMKVLNHVLGSFSYYDPQSQLLLSSYFYNDNNSNYGHETNNGNKGNYDDYFKDWARQMC